MLLVVLRHGKGHNLESKYMNDVSVSYYSVTYLERAASRRSASAVQQ